MAKNSTKLRSTPLSKGLAASASQSANSKLREQLDRASLFYKRGELHEALTVAKIAAKEHPTAPFPLFMIGNILSAQGSYRDAIDSFELALRVKADFAEVHNNIANIFNIVGKFEAAVERSQKALKINPTLVEAHNNLGNALAALDRHEEALASFQRALTFKPDYAHAHNGIGNVLAALERREEAIASFMKALEFKPDYALAHNGIGNVLNAAGRFESAVASCEAALRLLPDFAEAHNNLGNSYVGLGNFENAITCYNRALAIRPNFAKAYCNLAIALNELGKREQAIASATRSLEITPRNPEAHRLLARLFAQQGYIEKSRASYMSAQAIDDTSVSARLARGEMFLIEGKLGEARAEFEKVLELDPKNLDARQSISRVGKVREGDGNMLALIAAAEDAASLPDTRAIPLLFAVGKCYDDTGRYDLAFRHFDAGARIVQKRLLHGAADRTERYVENIKRFFTVENLGRLAGEGFPSKLPIFVLGMPRSGTTLTESILASHPSVAPGGELADLKEICNRPDGVPGYPVYLDVITPTALAAMGERYTQRLSTRAPDAVRITDKMPRNFFSLGLIHLMLPGAKIIHVRRNPIDTCLSNFMQYFERGHAHSYDLAELGRYYRSYDGLMNHWRSILPAGSFYEIHYENLVLTPENEIRCLLKYCDLEWNDSCLDFHRTERHVLTASVSQVRQPLYGNSIGKWRRYEKHLGPLLAELGELADIANSKST